MEVAQAGCGSGDYEQSYCVYFDVDQVVLVLERISTKKRLVGGDGGIVLEYIRCEDDVGNAGFVCDGYAPPMHFIRPHTRDYQFIKSSQIDITA